MFAGLVCRVGLGLVLAVAGQSAGAIGAKTPAGSGYRRCSRDPWRNEVSALQRASQAMEGAVVENIERASGVRALKNGAEALARRAERLAQAGKRIAERAAEFVTVELPERAAAAWARVEGGFQWRGSSRGGGDLARGKAPVCTRGALRRAVDQRSERQFRSKKMQAGTLVKASCALLLLGTAQCYGSEAVLEQGGQKAETQRPRGKEVAGVWSAMQHDLPFVKLTLREREGKLSGNVVLYVLRMEDGVWKSQGEETLDVVRPRVEGDELVFELPHAKRGGSTDPADQEIESSV